MSNTFEFVQHIFPGGQQFFLGGLRPLIPLYLRACWRNDWMFLTNTLGIM